MADLLHLADKPEGWTSHDVVARLRGILGERRVGHAGTLDPFASGLLVLGEGRTTALLSCIGLLPKRYVARALLGVETDTQDRTGTVVKRSEAIPDAAGVRAALERFRGPGTQVPPAYSAVKVGGERSYRAARRGEERARKPRPIHVYALELSSGPDASGPEVVLDVTVSRGTYVRTLAHDLGHTLGCGAHLTALRRVAIGPFRVEEALSPSREAGHDVARFRERALRPERALAFLPYVRLAEGEAERLRQGAAPLADPARVEAAPEANPLPPGEPGWPLALLDQQGALLAIARPIKLQRVGAPLQLLRVVASPRERAAEGAT